MKKLFYLILLLGLSFALESWIDTEYYGFIDPNNYWMIARHGVYVGKASCAVDGVVLSGDPCEQGESTVCAGTVVRYTPAINANWRTSDVRTATRYLSLNNLPFEDYSSTSTYRVKWLDNEAYYRYDAEGECFPGLGFGNGCVKQDIWDSYNEGLEELYPELGGSSTFNYPQAVTYGVLYPNTQFFSNKKGYPMVFCHGRYRVKYGLDIYVVLEEGDMADLAGPELTERVFTFDNPGRYAITTTLSDLDCFGAVVGHPRNDNNSPPNNISNFVLHFFGNYVYGSFDPHMSFSDQHIINVVDGDMAIDVRSNNIIARDGYGHYLLATVVQNTGDFAAKITGVSAGTLDGASATPSTSNWCRTYFGNWLECFLGNGYDRAIPPGSNTTLYTIFSYAGQEYGLCGQPSIFKLEFVPDGPACVPANESGSADVGGPCGSYPSCVITPQNSTIGPFEVHQWNVSCFTEQGAPTSCTGNDWRLEGMDGDIITKTSEYAYAVSYEETRTTGQIVYVQGDSRCTAGVTVDPSSVVAQCEFDPDSAYLDAGESQDFDLHCSLNGQPRAPDSADYDLTGGLAGTIQPYPNPVEGATFVSSDMSVGNLRGIGWFTSPSVPTLRGAVALAYIQVGCEEDEILQCHLEFVGIGPGGEYVYEQVCECIPIGQNQTGGGDDREKKFCVITPPFQQISTLQPGRASVSCFIEDENGVPREVECGLVSWTITENLARLSNQYGENVVFTAVMGATGDGTLTAEMADNNKECEAAFRVTPYTCPEIS